MFPAGILSWGDSHSRDRLHRGFILLSRVNLLIQEHARISLAGCTYRAILTKHVSIFAPIVQYHIFREKNIEHPLRKLIFLGSITRFPLARSLMYSGRKSVTKVTLLILSGPFCCLRKLMVNLWSSKQLRISVFSNFSVTVLIQKTK